MNIRTGWHTLPNEETQWNLVFVHGILSDSRSCWKANNGSYWPDLVSRDARLGHPGIYLANYYTERYAKDAGIVECAQSLYRELNRPAYTGGPTPLDSELVVFLCHSAGGLIVKYLVDEYWELLFPRKQIGLVLVGSPSSGSPIGSVLQPFARILQNKLCQELACDNETLIGLYHRFDARIRTQPKVLPKLFGIEAFEQRGVPLPPLPRVVPKRSATGHFDNPVCLFGCDHFTIVKPDSIDAEPHKMLVDFFIAEVIPRINQRKSRSTLEPPVSQGFTSSISSVTVVNPRSIPDTRSFIPDLIVPSLHDNLPIPQYWPLLITQLKERVLVATEAGNFNQLVELGQDIHSPSVAIEGASTELMRSITASGHYIQGEGYRLLSETGNDKLNTTISQLAALSHYDLAKGSPLYVAGAYRGQARVFESQGELGRADEYFKVAHILAQDIFNDQLQSGVGSTTLAHELMRISRHRLENIVRQASDASNSRWNREYERSEVERELYRCMQIHELYLGQYMFRPYWYWLEVFFANIAFAKCFAFLGSQDLAIYHLTKAAKGRLFSSSSNSTISEIEYINFASIINTAIRLDLTNYSSFKLSIERLALILEDKQREDLRRLISQI